MDKKKVLEEIQFLKKWMATMERLYLDEEEKKEEAS
jgi:hypothetical protein